LLPRNTEVVIIGGGVIGASILYHLSRRKITAVAVEQNELATGSSGACDGLIFLQSKKPGTHLQLALESKARFEHLQDELDLQVEYRNPGGMIITENEDELTAMVSLVEEQRNTGLDVCLLNPHEAREMEPSLSDAISGVTFCPLDAKVNPILLTLAFISWAQRHGGRAVTDCEVTGIEVKSRRVRAVHTTRGSIEGFVMAAGHEGDGVALSPGTGALIAELIDMGSTHIPLDEFALARFHP